MIRLLIGRWRMFWGLCPACNSDAPEIDTCRVCHGSREYPPPQWRKTLWWNLYRYN